MPFFPNTISIQTYLLGCILFFASCNARSDSGNKSNNDSTDLIALPTPGKITPQESDRIKSTCELWYDAVLQRSGFNGAMLVAKEGNIVFEKYNGTGHLPGTDTITQNTPLHIASVSKTFTAMAVLKLWQEGKLHIDDAFNKYFPDFNYPGVTIRCLLNHRSGLPNYNYFMEKLGWDKSLFAKNEDVLNYLITRKTELQDISTPNTHFTYCNTNYALLALLIEKISGLKYAAFLNKNFFVPLQMKNSYVFSLADTVKATPSYNWRGAPEAFNFLDAVYGDKNIYTTARDLLIWDQALTSGLFFTKETLEQAYAPYSNEKRGIRNYGLGWRMNLFPDGNKIIYHNGWWHGSNASFIRLLKEKATIIVIGNKFNRSVYHAKNLTPIFGNYDQQADDEESILLQDTIKSTNPSPDKKVTTQRPIKKKGLNRNKSKHKKK
jgi:CubicO group peptidase (beta-lactamase class C family)